MQLHEPSETRTPHSAMGIFETRQDLLTSKMRVGPQEIVDRFAGSQLAQNKFNGDPCALDHRLSDHDFWVDLDQLFHSHRIPLKTTEYNDASPLSTHHRTG